MTDQPSLADLDAAIPFSERHIGPDADAVATMLAAIGHDSLDALMDAAVPAQIRTRLEAALPEPATEREVASLLRELADANVPGESMIGLGYHGTITPPVIRRNLFEDPSWYTAYTPYQPEISQGRLEALINFQTMVGDLTGLPVANSSLLDEGTAAAEAMTLVRRANRGAAGTFVVDADALPQTIEVVRTRAEAMGIEVVVTNLAEGLPEGDISGVLLQYPGASGRIVDPRPTIDAAHERGALVVVAADLLALTLLSSPGTWAPTSRSARPSVSVFPCGAVARTPATCRCATDSSVTCRVDSSGSPSTPRGARPTASHSRPASSTSVVTRRRPTSAPLRCSSRSRPPCMPSTMGREG